MLAAFVVAVFVFAFPFFLVWTAPGTPWQTPYLLWLGGVVLVAAGPGVGLEVDTVNRAELGAKPSGKSARKTEIDPVWVKAQILLDRVHQPSPGFRGKPLRLFLIHVGSPALRATVAGESSIRLSVATVTLMRHRPASIGGGTDFPGSAPS